MASGFIKLSGTKSEKLIRASNSLNEKEDIQRFLNVYSVFSNTEIIDLIGIEDSKSYDLIKYYYDLLACNKKEHSVERMMSVDLRMNLADDLLIYTDKITMNYSLECRVPMLDTELIKFIESLPAKYKVKRGKTKIIHKAFAERLLPGSLINMPKKGFLSPTKLWFKKYYGQITDIILSNL